MGLRHGQPARLARTFLASLVLAALALLASLPASAVADPSIEVSRERVAAGEKIVVEGDDWESEDRNKRDDEDDRDRDPDDEELEVTLYLATEDGDDDEEEGDKVTDEPVEVENGRFRIEIKIPDDAKPGSTKLLARADGERLKAERGLEITGEQGDGLGNNADSPVPGVLPTVGEEDGSGDTTRDEALEPEDTNEGGSSRRSRPSSGGGNDNDNDRDKDEKDDDEKDKDSKDKNKGNDNDEDEDEETEAAPASSRQPPLSEDPGEGGGGLAWYLIVLVVAVVAAALAALPILASRWLSLSEPADSEALPPTTPLS